MRTILLVLAALALVAPAAALEAPVSQTRQYIVAFTADPGLRAGDVYHGAEVLQHVEGLEFLVVRSAAPSLFEAQVVLDEDVRYFQLDNPNAATLSLVPNDARYGDAGHWGSKKIGAEAAWDRTTGSASVKVAMIDSGLSKGHEEWSGSTRVLQGYDFVNNDNDPNDQSGCSWHGSHTTGTAGATINNAKGIAGMSQHTILPIKAFYPSFIFCTSSSSALVNSLKYSGDQGAHVSSNSWGSSSSDAAINDAVQYAADRGVIVVAATSQSDAQVGFSSEGPEVDVAAPGVGILSLCGSSATCYQNLDGTSMATPHVVGTAALLKAQNPSWTFSDVESRLRSTAVDLGVAGRINADAATNNGPARPGPRPRRARRSRSRPPTPAAPGRAR